MANTMTMFIIYASFHAGTPPPLPMFTSCCPAWVTLVETEYPELIPHLPSNIFLLYMYLSLLQAHHCRCHTHAHTHAC
jgi:hypothetical protein